MLLYFTKIFSFNIEKCYISTCQQTPAIWISKGKSPGTKEHSHNYSCEGEHCLSFTFLISDAALPETGSVGHRRWRAAWMGAFARGAGDPRCWADPRWSKPKRPKPLFSCFSSLRIKWLSFASSSPHSLPTGVAFRFFPRPRRTCWLFSVLFFFSSCSLGRSKWPARIQLATCPSQSGVRLAASTALHQRLSRQVKRQQAREKGK